MPRSVVGKVQDLHSVPSVLANKFHLKCSPWGKSWSSFLPTTIGRSNGMTPSVGAGRNASSISSLKTVPALKS